MPRNRHKKKPANIAPPPPPQPAGNPAEKPSPVAQKVTQKVVQRILNGGPEYLSDNLERVLIGSERLAEEPEFIDLSFDENKAAKVTERWLKKYEKRLLEAQKKSEDEFQQVYDDVRIKIIDELITPAFRKDVEQRLDRLQERLSIKGDAKTLEIVIMLKPILGMKQTPWGLCGLIIAIYDRAMKQVVEAHADEIEIMNAIGQALKEEGMEESDLDSLVETPNDLDRIGQKLLQKNPGLQDRLERQAWEIIEQFEQELSDGKIALALFTNEELLLPFQRLDEEYGGPVTDKRFTEDQQKHNIEVIMQTIREMMTPERQQRLRNDVEAAAKAWARERKYQKYAPVLDMEIGWLEEENGAVENQFVLSAFFGQLTRASKEQKKKR
jgi:hypothetical protein